MLVRFHMTAGPTVIGPKDSLAATRAALDRNGVRQLPVVHDGLLVGIVTDRDLRIAQQHDERVEDIMSRDPVTVASGATVDEAARLLRRTKVNALPVVDDDELQGIITTSDVLDAFVQLSGVTEPSYRLVLGVTTEDEVDEVGATERVRQILSEHRSEILWLKQGSRPGDAHVHVRLRTDHIDELQTSLEAAGIEVITTIASVGDGGD